jgi:hypothetical protein
MHSAVFVTVMNYWHAPILTIRSDIRPVRASTSHSTHGTRQIRLCPPATCEYLGLDWIAVLKLIVTAKSRQLGIRIRNNYPISVRSLTNPLFYEVEIEHPTVLVLLNID